MHEWTELIKSVLSNKCEWSEMFLRSGGVVKSVYKSMQDWLGLSARRERIGRVPAGGDKIGQVFAGAYVTGQE